MGTGNVVTKDKYNTIKADINAALASGKYNKLSNLDEAMGAKHGYSPSTAHNIRVTKDYDAYAERVFRFHGNPKTRRVNYKPKYKPEVAASDMDDGTKIIEIVDSCAAEPHNEWLVTLLITLFALIVVEGIIIFMFWSKYVN